MTLNMSYVNYVLINVLVLVNYVMLIMTWIMFLTGNEVYPDDLEACHRLKKKENVIIKFKSRKLKYKVINNRKIMKNKSKELNELKFSNNLYISESMCAGNHSLFFKCRKLKKARKIFNTWFFIKMGKSTKFSILKILQCCWRLMT